MKFKQPVEGGEAESEIKKEKTENLNGPGITAPALKSNMSCFFIIYKPQPLFLVFG